MGSNITIGIYNHYEESIFKFYNTLFHSNKHKKITTPQIVSNCIKRQIIDSHSIITGNNYYLDNLNIDNIIKQQYYYDSNRIKNLYYDIKLYQEIQNDYYLYV